MTSTDANKASSASNAAIPFTRWSNGKQKLNIIRGIPQDVEISEHYTGKMEHIDYIRSFEHMTVY